MYGGLKQFTVRMAAKNTTFGELLGGREFGHSAGTRVIVAFTAQSNPTS